MARTQQQVIDDLVTQLESIDPSVSWRQGPIYDWVIRIIPSEVVLTEQIVDYIKQLWSLQLSNTITEEDALAKLTVFGMSKKTGGYARARQVFYTTTPPGMGESFILPIGTIVATQDKQLQYTVVGNEDYVIDGVNYKNYYNVTTNRYEITVVIEAVSTGSEYEIPMYRITECMSDISWLSGTTNITQATIVGRETDETTLEALTRLTGKFLGMDLGSYNGIRESIKNDYTNVEDCSLVSSQNTLFTRLVPYSGVDIYAISQLTEPHEETFLGGGNEQLVSLPGIIDPATEIILTIQPVFSVDWVELNGTRISYIFVKSTSMDYFDSTKAQDAIIIPASEISAVNPGNLILKTGDTITVSYNYYKDIVDIQNKKTDSLFNVDILVRRGIEIPIYIELSLVTTGSGTVFEEDVINALNEWLEVGKFSALEDRKGIFSPDEINNAIAERIGGVISAKPIKFYRETNPITNLDVIKLDENETAILSENCKIQIK